MNPLERSARAEVLISVDVETSGPSPSGYALLSIGACVMDEPDRGFYVELQPDRDGALAEALAVSGLDPAELARTGTAPAEAMARMAEWLDSVAPGALRPVFVGFNAPFDWMFVADYFERYLGRNPFGHSALDVKSYAMGATGRAWRDTSMTSLASLFIGGRVLRHNALEDARDQAELFRAVRASVQEGTTNDSEGRRGR